jgi:hypothetical protein
VYSIDVRQVGHFGARLIRIFDDGSREGIVANRASVVDDFLRRNVE